MAQFQEKSFDLKLDHQTTKIVYSDYGKKDAEPVLYIHGAYGNGQDFDIAAKRLVAQGYRVLSPDLPGRGRSDNLTDPREYTYKTYIAMADELLRLEGLDKPCSVIWVGRSTGGLMGFRVAARPNTPIKKFIVNDIGPSVPQDQLDATAEDLKTQYIYPDFESFLEAVIESCKDEYGPVTESQWRFIASVYQRVLPDGRITYAYDTAMREAWIREPIGPGDIWQDWDKIICPVLIYRGAKSKFLPKDIADKMMRRGPGAKGLCTLKVFDDCGHVPAMIAKEHTDILLEWLMMISEDRQVFAGQAIYSYSTLK